MSIFSNLFDSLEHDAKPLLSAAAKWAETEGLDIVKEVGANVAAMSPGELTALFNVTLGTQLGLIIPVASKLTSEALDLLVTALARNLAQQRSGNSLRASVLNAGVEQALLLLKGQKGDTDPKPSSTLVTKPEPVTA